MSVECIILNWLLTISEPNTAQLKPYMNFIVGIRLKLIILYYTLHLIFTNLVTLSSLINK